MNIQEWVFSEADGRHHIVLGGSNVLPLKLKDIADHNSLSNMVLGYANERGDNVLREK